MSGIGQKRLWLTLAVLVVVSTGAWLYLRGNGGLPGRSEAAAKPQPVSLPSRIACLGHIEPKDGIVSISGRGLAGQPAIVGELRVHEGDWVRAGQVVAVLDSRRQLEEAIRNLNQEVAVAQSRAAVARSGPKKGDIDAQAAEIARLEASLAGARIDADRFEQLYQTHAATVIERDQRRLLVETTTQMLNQAKSRLQSLQEVRDVDVKLAEAQVQGAMAAVARAEAELEPSIVHAPFNGRVLRIRAHPGEEVGPKGILDIARTDRMYAIGEVVESDVNRVRVGQKATVSSEDFAQPLEGEVESIGSQVAREDVVPTDPVSFSDARVVEVRIRLYDSAIASRLIHGKITAMIEP